MGTVSVRELRNYGGHVLDSVERGETMTITRDGKPVAELRPLQGSGLNAHALLEKWRGAPEVDADALRADISEIMDLEL